MDWSTVLAAAGSSAVLSAIVAGFVARRNSERAIQMENITKERAKWRDKIRDQALAVHKAAAVADGATLRQLRLQLSLNLNPTDTEDLAILGAISRLEEARDSADKVQLEFADRVSLLLKHDWERAKREAKHGSIPDRMSYSELQGWRNAAQDDIKDEHSQ